MAAPPAINTPLPKPPGFQEDTNWKEEAPGAAQGASGWTENDNLPSVTGAAPDLSAGSVLPTVWNMARAAYRDAQKNPQGYMAGLTSQLMSKLPTPIRAAAVGGAGAASQLGIEAIAKPYLGQSEGFLPAVKNIADQALRQGSLEYGVGKLADAVTPARLIASQIGDKVIREHPHIPETMLKYGANPSAGGARKIQTAIDGINSEIGDLIKQNPNATISMDQALNRLKDLKTQATNQLTGQAVPYAHDAPSELIEKIDDHIAKMQSQHPQAVPISNLQNIKKNLREKAGEYGRAATPGSTDIQQLHKLQISGINDELSKAVNDPSLKAKLLEEAKLMDTREAIENSLPNKRSMLPAGVTRPLVGAVGGAALGDAAHGNEYRDPMATAVGALGGAAAGSIASPGNIARVIAQIGRVPGAGQAVTLPARVLAGRNVGNSEIWKKYNEYLDKKKSPDTQ